jgi:CIC family chloride channel protein
VWTTPQANVPGQGLVAGYTGRFWLAVLGTGLVAGVAASSLVALLHFVEHVAYGYHSGAFLTGVAAAAAWRHLAALAVAALVVVASGRWASRLPASGATDVAEAVWLRGASVAGIGSLIRAVVSIVAVGLGVSLGREGAPQLVGAVGADRLGRWAGVPLWQRRLLVASGAGAGFAAVYNVPLGGSLFALEVLLGTLSLPLVLPALSCAVIATAVAWITLGTGPTYRLPSYGIHPAQLMWAVLAGPIIGVVAIVWVRLVATVAARRPRGRGRLFAPPVAFLALALVSIPYPQLLGNGKGVVQLAALGGISLGLLCVLLVLKPLATAACLGSGSPGGLFTPTLTVGVLLASVLGVAWDHVWPGARLGSYAVIGGGAFLAAAMQGPLSGIVLVLELTRNFDSLMVPTLVAVIEATVIARRLGAPSIYSARLARTVVEGADAAATSHATASAAMRELGDPPTGPDRPPQ